MKSRGSIGHASSNIVEGGGQLVAVEVERWQISSSQSLGRCRHTMWKHPQENKGQTCVCRVSCLAVPYRVSWFGLQSVGRGFVGGRVCTGIG